LKQSLHQNMCTREMFVPFFAPFALVVSSQQVLN